MEVATSKTGNFTDGFFNLKLVLIGLQPSPRCAALIRIIGLLYSTQNRWKGMKAATGLPRCVEIVEQPLTVH